MHVKYLYTHDFPVECMFEIFFNQNRAKQAFHITASFSHLRRSGWHTSALSAAGARHAKRACCWEGGGTPAPRTHFPLVFNPYSSLTAQTHWKHCFSITNQLLGFLSPPPSNSRLKTTTGILCISWKSVQLGLSSDWLSTIVSTFQTAPSTFILNDPFARWFLFL